MLYAATRFPRDAKFNQRGVLAHAMVFQLDFTGGKYTDSALRPINRDALLAGKRDIERELPPRPRMRRENDTYVEAYRRREYQPLPLRISQTGNNINIARRVR